MLYFIVASFAVFCLLGFGIVWTAKISSDPNKPKELMPRTPFEPAAYAAGRRLL